MLPLVVATDAGVRDYITRLVAKVLNEETEEIVDELSSSNGGGEVQREWVFLKQLVDVLDKVHELVRSRDNEYRAAPNLKLEAFKNSKIQEENQDDELDESFWAEDNGAEVRVVNDLVVSVEDFVGSDKPAEMVRLVVESLWEDNDALKVKQGHPLSTFKQLKILTFFVFVSYRNGKPSLTIYLNHLEKTLNRLTL